MIKFLSVSLFLLIAAAGISVAGQQQSAAPDLASRVPSAKTADVDSIDHIMFAIYDVISGPPGQRDWNRFRSLFVPEVASPALSSAKDPTPYACSLSKTTSMAPASIS